MDKKPFDKTIIRIKKIADKLDDFRLAIRLSAVIACITKDRNDIIFALEKAKGHGIHQSSTAEALSIIVKTLARALRFDEAKEVFSQMKGMDNYWVAESAIAITRFSHNKNDISIARNAISCIRSHHLRNEARIDLEIALTKHHHSKACENTTDLKELAKVLDSLSAFEDSHVVSPKINSARLRLLAEMIIDHIFAEMMA